MKNQESRGPDTSGIFPLTVKFNYERYGTPCTAAHEVVGMRSQGNDPKTVLYLEAKYSDGDSIEATVNVDFSKAFDECAAAKAEGRYADLTKFEKKPGPWG